MVGQADLVIICVSVGVALGVLIASLIFFFLRRYKKRAHLRRSANEPSSTTLPIRTNGLGTSTEFSASLTSSIANSGSDNLQRKSHFTWWNHQNKDPIAPASGILKYSYKYALFFSHLGMNLFLSCLLASKNVLFLDKY